MSNFLLPTFAAANPTHRNRTAGSQPVGIAVWQPALTVSSEPQDSVHNQETEGHNTESSTRSLYISRDEKISRYETNIYRHLQTRTSLAPTSSQCLPELLFRIERKHTKSFRNVQQSAGIYYPSLNLISNVNSNR